MSQTFLLDLDGTLLQNDIDKFLPAYLAAFGRLVAPYIDPERFTRLLMMGTQEMVKNRQPDQTLQDTFEAAFFTRLGMDRELFQPLADKFYAEIFPSLQPLTRPTSGAVKLLDVLSQGGHHLAIATNPLFPRTAILQRLEWAGTPAACYPFETITSYESYHFAKPSPVFLAEVLARLGWPEGDMLVVGDNMEHEIIPGRSIGLPVFWIEQPGVTAPTGSLAPSSRGALTYLLPWLEGAAPQALQPDFNSPEAMLATLRSTPAAIDSWQRATPAATWSTRPVRGEWSAVEVVCHLRDVEIEVNLPRLHKIIAGSNPFVPGQDTDPWAEQRKYLQQDERQAFQQFCQARLESLALLEALDTVGWQQPARHAILGPTHLSEMVGIIASHDRLHIRQIRNALKVQAVLN